jgi:hypothetical protein
MAIAILETILNFPTLAIYLSNLNISNHGFQLYRITTSFKQENWVWNVTFNFKIIGYKKF